VPTAHLSPEYVLAPVRLDSDKGPLPGIVLHSPTFTWPFDPDPYVLSGPAELVVRAHQVGLWSILDPFAPVPDADQTWTFRLPNPVRAAALTGPSGVLVIERPPKINAAWWSMAVTQGARCTLLIVACVRFPDAAAGESRAAAAAATLNAALVDGRVVGASIAVEF